MWLDEVRPRAGRTVPLKVLTRSYRGAEKISTIPIEIPANASGQLTVMVTDGRQLNQIEQRELRRSVQPTSVAQMIKVLNQSHRNNRVYVRLLTGTPGAVVNGEALTVAASLGARRARRRSQQRQLHPDPQRRARRVGAHDGLGDHAARACSRSISTAVLAVDARPSSQSAKDAQANRCGGGARRGPQSAVLLASTPTFWTVSTQADFLKGDVENLSIDSDGRVFLGPVTAQVAETSAPFLWTVLSGADGTLWAGTGNEGQVLKIAPDGKTSTFFDAGEMEVHALAPAPNGGLFVATSPDGKIYQVAADGTSQDLLRSGRQVHLGARRRARRPLFAATGEKGNIYRITPTARDRSSTRRTPPTSWRSRSTRRAT